MKKNEFSESASIAGVGSLLEILPGLQNSIFLSKDNKEFQSFAQKIVSRKLKELEKCKEEANYYATLLDAARFAEPMVARVLLSGISIYSNFIIYVLNVDMVDGKGDWEVVDSSMGPAYDTDRLVSVRLEVFVDTVNGKEFFSVSDMGISSRVEPLNKENDGHLMPVGQIGGYWPVLPASIEFEKKYSSVPKGSVLSLNPDKELYEGKGGGFPAIMYHYLATNRLPVTPEVEDILTPSLPVAENIEEVDDIEDPFGDDRIPEDRYDKDEDEETSLLGGDVDIQDFLNGLQDNE